jgi:hypothetical protein
MSTTKSVSERLFDQPTTVLNVRVERTK